MPIRICNSAGADLSIRSCILHPLLRPWNVNNSIDNCMTDVYSFWTKLLRQRRGQCAKGILARVECGHQGVGFDGCGRAGEDECGWVFRLFHAVEEEWERRLREEEGSASVLDLPSAVTLSQISQFKLTPKRVSHRRTHPRSTPRKASWRSLRSH
jgi:hypothetical protein